MVRRVKVPCPSFLCAMGMNQFVEKNLSAPRGAVCWISFRKTSPWNISIQVPSLRISISSGVEFGSASVPEVACCSSKSIRELGCPFIVGWSADPMPGMFSMDSPVWVCPGELGLDPSWARDERVRVMTVTKYSIAFSTDHSILRSYELPDDSSTQFRELDKSRSRLFGYMRNGTTTGGLLEEISRL